MSRNVGRTNLSVSETIKINDALKGRLKLRHTREKDGVKVWEYVGDFSDEAVAKVVGTTVYKVAQVRLGEYGELLRGDEGVGVAKYLARIEALESEQRLTTERLLDAAKAVTTLQAESKELRAENKALAQRVETLEDLVTRPPSRPGNINIAGVTGGGIDPTRFFNGTAKPNGR